MLSPKILVEKAKKGIPLMRSASSSSSSGPRDCCTTVVADKDQFTVYTVDDTRFMVPLAFLKSPILQQLLKMSEEEFGSPGDGPITVACTVVFMEYILSLLQRHTSGDVERALLAFIDANWCSTSVLNHLGKNHHQLVELI